jgi:hypothetical protein
VTALELTVGVNNRQLKTYPTPGRAWFYKSLFWGSKLPRGPGKYFQKVGGFAPHLLAWFPGPPGQLRPPKQRFRKNKKRKKPDLGLIVGGSPTAALSAASLHRRLAGDRRL